MRHLKSRRKLGVSPSHRRALLRNLVTSLLEHERVVTTLARAKELRRPLDQMITLGKKGDLASRRYALRFVRSKQAMTALFGELAERYRERPGGYSRLYKIDTRRGDGAPMAVVALVDSSKDPRAETTSQTGQRRRRRASRSTDTPSTPKDGSQ